jgi:hypothetical protein
MARLPVGGLSRRTVALPRPLRARPGMTDFIPVPWPGRLPATARLSWSAAASQLPLRSRRSLAQYSSRFLISRSKPRSGGS